MRNTNFCQVMHKTTYPLLKKKLCVNPNVLCVIAAQLLPNVNWRSRQYLDMDRKREWILLSASTCITIKVMPNVGAIPQRPQGATKRVQALP